MNLKKRGQVSLEHVAIVGLILVLLIPFFIFVFRSISSNLVEYYAVEAVNNVAAATVTVSTLTHNSKMDVPVRSQSISSNGIGDGSTKNTVSVNIPSGSVITFGANNLAAGIETMTKDGLFFIPVRNVLDVGVVIGEEPAILGVLAEDEALTFESIQHGSSSIRTNKDFNVYGANFNDPTTTVKIDGTATPQFTILNDNIIEVGNQGYGVGSHTVQVINSKGSSKIVSVIIVSGKIEKK